MQYSLELGRHAVVWNMVSGSPGSSTITLQGIASPWRHDYTVTLREVG